MKGYTIQHSIDLLEKAVDNGSGGASTAADVSYDNTSSHLTADDVQEAIDELNAAIGQISGEINISSTESKIGTYNGEDLYIKSFETTVTTSSFVVENQLYVADVLDIVPADASVAVNVVINNGIYYFGGQTKKNEQDHFETTLMCLYAQSATPVKGYCLYTKAAPTRTRKKK